MMHGYVTGGSNPPKNISTTTQNFSAADQASKKAAQSPFATADQIHARAVEICSRYKKAEAELIDVLLLVEEHRVFIERGHASLFQYVVSELGLGENTAYSLITVARKSRQVPELKAFIQSGEMTLTNARRIAPVLTPQNQAEWLSKATTLSSRQLEKEVIKACPREATPERASYVNHNRIRLELGLSEHEMLRLRRVQDLMSQAQRRPLKLEEVIEALNAEYLRRNDPLEIAKRHRVKQAAPSPIETVKTLVARRVNSKPEIKHRREHIPAAILHQVNLRDQRRCTHTKRDGTRCNQTRWIEIHHKTPVSQGGPNTLDNLVTRCSTHHKFAHL